jgi:hypothetical protein
MTYTYDRSFNYQATTRTAMGFPPQCSPSAIALQRFLMLYGGRPLGCYQDRPVRGGSAPSTHSFGAVPDWRYANVGSGFIEVGRAKAIELIEWLIADWRSIGLNRIHDYVGGRAWTPERGWHAQRPSRTGMGQKWAQWFHIEIHPDAWYDNRSIPARSLRQMPLIDIHNVPNPPFQAPPPVTPEAPAMQTVSVTVDSLQVLTIGSSGPEVVKLQCLLRWVFGQQEVVPDGNFGPVTEQAVRNAQAWTKITTDGIVGAQTWRAILDA